ncbi:MAG: hypothetical protein OXF09_08315 [Hyphomicrobiales bacterium]|nr:hypothetical protein [Hyphomicrobiales bacterium]
MKIMKVDNESALSRTEAAIERLRVGVFIQMIGVVAVGVAVLGAFMTYLQFFK